MPEINKPAAAKHWVAYSGNIVHYGVTDINQVTTTGQSSLDSYDSEQELLQGMATANLSLPAMPGEGEAIIAGEIYDYSGTLYQVRQSHTRTTHDPDSVPALFSKYQGGTSLNWIEQEQVFIGDVRTYNGTDYECIQSHQTQTGWEPPNVPALWVVASAGTEWAAGVAYSVDDEVTYGGNTYRCLQAHTSIVTWEPPNVPALWQLI